MPENKTGGLHFGAGLSRQVSWFETYSYAARLAAEHDATLSNLPFPGTPQWCGLPDDDARKLLALLLGGVREALHNEVHQEHLADAGKKIAEAMDANALAQNIIQGRGPAYIERKSA